jgi:hypothetical protein
MIHPTLADHVRREAVKGRDEIEVLAGGPAATGAKGTGGAAGANGISGTRNGGTRNGGTR